MWSAATHSCVARSLRLSRISRCLPLLVPSLPLVTSSMRLPPPSVLALFSLPRARMYSTDETVTSGASVGGGVDAKRHRISTLDPSKLLREDYVDLSGVDWTSVKILADRDATLVRKESTRTLVGPAVQTLGLVRLTRGTLPYRTAGFLYLRKAPEGTPETTAEIRMRITNDPDPASFPNGSDLVQDGLPWRFPITKCNVSWSLSLIKRDALLSETAQTRLKNIGSPGTLFWTRFKRSSAVLYSRSQPFIVDISQHALVLGLNAEVDGRETVHCLTYVLPQKATHVVQLEEEASDAMPAGDESKRAPIYEPLYTGRAICRFEWTPEEKGTWFDLRVLKILEPIRAVHPDLPELKEGSIVPCFDFATGTPSEAYRHLVDVTSVGKFLAAAVLCGMPDIPVDSEYLNSA